MACTTSEEVRRLVRNPTDLYNSLSAWHPRAGKASGRVYRTGTSRRPPIRAPVRLCAGNAACTPHWTSSSICPCFATGCRATVRRACCAHPDRTRGPYTCRRCVRRQQVCDSRTQGEFHLRGALEDDVAQLLVHRIGNKEINIPGARPVPVVANCRVDLEWAEIARETIVIAVKEYPPQLCLIRDHQPRSDIRAIIWSMVFAGLDSAPI